MSVIYIDLLTFARYPSIIISEEGKENRSQNIELDKDFGKTIAEIAKASGITKIKIQSGKEYAQKYIKDIQEAYAMAYGENNLEIEVI